MTTREYLQQCTVRLNYKDSQGTGFFAAPGLILTCAHVVKVAEDKPINVFWKANNKTYTAKTEELGKYSIDLALLKLEGDIPNHSCVDFDEKEPIINKGLYIFGYPKAVGIDYSQGDSVTVTYEGESFKENVLIYKLKDGQIIEGFSGSPLLNLMTGKVCGMVHLSGNNNLGGRAIPTKVILEQFPDIPDMAKLNQQFHQQQKPRDSNPFTFGPPVQPDGFYGRRKAILDLKNRIGAIEPQCINIVGLRRNGKTSLFRYINLFLARNPRLRNENRGMKARAELTGETFDSEYIS